ncbi:hypothetical protein TELCIR_14643, partial [Teladorsagia circumcincta]
AMEAKDLKDPKDFLYGWLGKQKIGAPQYSITAITRGGTQRFKTVANLATTLREVDVTKLVAWIIGGSSRADADSMDR